MQQKATRIIGIIGTAVCIGFVIKQPSWPTPDKLLVFVTFIFMMFGQGWAVVKRLFPFVALLVTYDSFRSIAPHLNKHVHYMEMVRVDRWLFGGTLPTTTLQNWIMHNSAQWYDFLLYITYMMHFIMPIGLALLVWKTRDKHYWRVVTTYLTVSFLGFFTFLTFPAAPPWLASQNGYIEHVTRVSSNVWWALGIHDFPTLYHKFSPNPVAAVPSLHAAYATLLFIFVYKLYGKKWGLLAALYPALIYFGTVYMGEHYAIDEILGALYAAVAYFVVAWVWKKRSSKRQEA